MVYTPANKTVGYAEDVTFLDDEVVAIENTLGTNPEGAYATVKAWLTALTSLLDTHASRHQNGGADEISVAGLSGALADPQTPTLHASSHARSGSDEVTQYDLGITKTIAVFIDGGGAEITTGIKGVFGIMSTDAEIIEILLLADQTGSIVIDIWNDTYGNYPPTDADSITSATPPTISSSNKAQDVTLTGWSKNLAKGNTLMFNVDSVTDIEWCMLEIKIRLKN